MSALDFEKRAVVAKRGSVAWANWSQHPAPSVGIRTHGPGNPSLICLLAAKSFTFRVTPSRSTV